MQFHGSRLNDLLGVWFVKEDNVGKIRYILFNPMAAKTDGAKQMASGVSGFIMKIYYSLFGKMPEELAGIIANNISKTEKAGLYAYLVKKPVDLSMTTFSEEKAKKLNDITTKIYMRNKTNVMH